MSDDSDDTPLNFPHSEPDYYPEIVENDKREESPEIWQPETLQIMEDHGLSPEDFEVVSEEELDKEEEPEGEVVYSFT